MCLPGRIVGRVDISIAIVVAGDFEQVLDDPHEIEKAAATDRAVRKATLKIDRDHVLRVRRDAINGRDLSRVVHDRCNVRLLTGGPG